MPKYRFSEIAFNSTAKKKPTEADKDTYIGLEHLDSGSLTVSRWGSDVAPIGEKLIMKRGDVLFGKRRAYQKKVAIAPFDGIFSAHGMVLRPNEAVITQEYFPLFISSDYFLDEAIRISVGSLSPTVNWKDLKDLSFNIPTIEEQRRITPLVWAAIESKNAYIALLERTDELVKSQFIEMFGDPIENPMGWQKRELQEIVSSDCSISYGIVKTGDDIDGGIPVFRPVDIVGKIPKRSELKRTTLDISNQYKRSLLTGRDLLVTVRANIADTFIAEEEFRGCNVGRGIVPIRTDESLILLEFLKAQIDFDSLNVYMKSLAKGITLIQLNMEDLRKVSFILPPIDTQKQYITMLKQADKSKFELKQAIERIDNLIKSLIQQG